MATQQKMRIPQRGGRRPGFLPLALLPLLLLLLLLALLLTTAAAARVDKATTISSSGSGKVKKGTPSSHPSTDSSSSRSPVAAAEQLAQKARRRAILFARARKSDEDMEELVTGFAPEEHGAIFYEVGRVFSEGVTGENGVVTLERSLERGLKYLVRSARDFGYPHAQHRLAVAYVTGVLGTPPPLPLLLPAPPRPEDVEPDEQPGAEAAAMLLTQFSAMGGDVAAAMALGYRYLYGHGTPLDCDRSVLYYEIAANAAIEEMERLKVLPPNERARLSDAGALGLGPAARRRAVEADQQLVDYYQHTADKGDVGAQVALGKLYFHGSSGVPQNLAKAAVYFEQAAKAGDAVASGSIGHMYLLGVGVKQNNETARRFFVRGQDHGDAASLNGLGHLYMYGMGVEKNLEKAVRYFQKAAHEKGHAESFYNLGLIYSAIVKEGAEDDNVYAKKPLAGEEDEAPTGKGRAPSTAAGKRLAQLKDDPLLANLPAEMLDTLADITNHAAELEKVVAENVAEAAAGGEESKAIDLSRFPTKSGGVPEASLTSSSGTGSHTGVKKNLAKALKYFSLAAQSGHMGALHKIGQMYSQGIATPRACSTAVHAFKSVAERGPWVQNLNKALAKHKQGDLLGALLLYIHLAEIGYEVAQSNAAVLLEEGTCGALEPLACQALSVRYYRHASKQGNAEASLKVGDAYYYGTAGLPVDFSRAARYYQAAAELRQPQAMFNLGLMHQYGVGLKQDFHLAKRYLDSSAETHPDAKWPVNLTLLGLYLHWWLVGEDRALAQTPIVTTARPAGILVENSLVAAWAKAWMRKREQLRQWWDDLPAHLGGGGGRASHDQGEEGGGDWTPPNLRELVPALDTILIVLLSTAFLYVMRVRATARESAARRRRRQQEESTREASGAPQQQQQPPPPVAAARAHQD